MLPFGERYAQSGSAYNVDSFTGQPDQITSDEYDFTARELHNGQGRWVSPDPLSGTGNKYAYSNNNPLREVDLLGMLPVMIAGIADSDTLEGEKLPGVTTADNSESHSEQETQPTADTQTPATDSASSTPPPAQQDKKQEQTPADVRVVNKVTYTKKRPEINKKTGAKFAGTVYTYQVVDASKKDITTPAIVKENLTKTSTTTDMPSAATWDTTNGRFDDAVGYTTEGGKSFPANYHTDVMQTFTVIEDSGQTNLDTQRSLTISSDSKGDMSGSSVPVP